MKKNLLITALLLTFIINLIPIQSQASPQIQPIEEINIPILQGVGTNLNWNLSSRMAKTKSITCTKNSTITISCTSSVSSARVQLGIIDPDGTYHTAGIKGSGSYSYNIPNSGTHKIYCKNSSSSSISVSISYEID